MAELLSVASAELNLDIMSADAAGEDEFLPGTLRLVREGNLVLNPMPTQSPNDPLRWSWQRKYYHATLVCIIAGLTAATSNDAGSAATAMSDELGITYDSQNTGAGILFIAIGVMAYIISPSSWLYGRRISYIVCLLSGLAGSIWFARVRYTHDAIWNQLFVGASEACAEATIQLSLSDLFYEHQLGSAIGVYVLATSVGTFLGPLIAGYIADGSMGWRWTGWWGAIISGGTILVCLFSLEETIFERPSADVILAAETAADCSQANGHNKGKDLEKHAVPFVEMGMGTTVEQPKTYWQRIAIITPASNIKGTGFNQYMQRLLHTFRLFSFPSIIFSGLQWGAQDCWLSFYLTLEEDYWVDAPWNYSDAAVSLMNVPCIIGAFIGCVYGGYCSDVFVIWMAKRSNGVREPEQRLWFLIPCACVSAVGMWLFGIGTARGWSWPAPYVGLGLIGFGWVRPNHVLTKCLMLTLFRAVWVTYP